MDCYVTHSSSNNENEDTDNESPCEAMLEDDIDYDSFVFIGSCLISMYYQKYIVKTPCMTSKQTGEVWVRDVLYGHRDRCMINFRMPKEVFVSLLHDLQTKYGLKGSRNISTIEILAMLLYILGHGASNRVIRERFQRSGETISRYFTCILSCVSRMACDIITPLDSQFNNIPEPIRKDQRYMPHFKVK